MTIFPELSAPIRSALIADASITALLEAYKGSWPVFTRTPVPDDAPSLVVVISQNTSAAHQDGINDQRLVITRDVIVSGDSETDWRSVDSVARQIARRFHRRPGNLSVSGWHCYDIRVNTAGGQSTELDQSVSMVVTLEIRLAAAS